jgi:Flagellar basal body protein FlaE
MNHCGRGWVVAAMALQLVACGNAPGDAEDPEQHVIAHPPRAADDVAGDASATGASSARTGSDVHVADSEPVVEDDAAVSAGGWKGAHCVGSATRHVRIAGNCYAGAGVFFEPFSPERPEYTSSLGTTFVGFDDEGHSQSVTVYFVPLERGWDYHAVTDGTALVVGEGHLNFDDQGVAVTVEERQELRLLTTKGPGHAVALDLSGMTRVDAASTITAQEVDGSECPVRRWQPVR